LENSAAKKHEIMSRKGIKVSRRLFFGEFAIFILFEKDGSTYFLKKIKKFSGSRLHMCVAE
jgi:hypothetical protein